MGSSYRVYGPATVLSGGVMSGGATISSKTIDIASFPYAAFQAVWTGTPTGTFKVECSIDGTNYYDIGATIPSASGGAGNTLIPLQVTLPYKYARLSYTNSSGIGTLDVTGFAKAGA